jgi:hypothetical protein
MHTSRILIKSLDATNQAWESEVVELVVKNARAAASATERPTDPDDAAV